MTFRFDDPAVTGFTANSSNTHWPAANVALFDSPLLDAISALTCNGDALGMANWGVISQASVPSQQYFVGIDGQIPAGEPGTMPEGAFSLSITRDGDMGDATWTTTTAPVDWPTTEAELLANEIRVASVISPLGMGSTLVAEPDARAMANITGRCHQNRRRVGGPNHCRDRRRSRRCRFEYDLADHR